MQDRDNAARYYFRSNDPLRSDTPEETELAYQLQNSTPNDPELLERIVHLYSGDLYNWVAVLLFYRKMTYPSHGEIISILKKVFGKALVHVEQFHGQAKVSSWLFTISYQMAKRQKIRDETDHLDQGGKNYPENAALSDMKKSTDWPNLDDLPEKIRSAVLLRYLFDLGIPDIANILNVQIKDVHRRLVYGRNRLLGKTTESHLEPQIQAYVDGLLDEQPDELLQLMQHLETCHLCQASTTRINSLEKILAESMKKRWLVSALSEEDLNGLVQSILSEIKQPKVWWKANLPMRQTAWIFGLTLTFIGLAIVFIRMTPEEKEFPQLNSTATPQLPPIIARQTQTGSLQYANEIPGAPQYIEPAFSKNGKWAVFALIKSIPNTWDRLVQTIEVYNREANTIQVINEGHTLSTNWGWWDLVPGISADGRWIAYVSATNDPNTTGDPCETSDHGACLDVFLYDRDTGSTRRLTQARNGGAADGDSLAPTFSEDGKWVAFWSAASNLVDGFNDDCQQGETIVTCLYIYLYNLEITKIERIPIPTITRGWVFSVDRISLSADGRYVGFTATHQVHARIPTPISPLTFNNQENSTDSPVVNTSLPDILHSSEAIVYDRETGSYEMENQAQDGTPGNRESFTPVISADGRYVAFVSNSTNIVAGDTNYYSDVYLRDRESGKLELVSVSSNGYIGKGDSGLALGGMAYYGLNMSGDGRYLVFESTAPNLGQDIYPACNQEDIRRCNIIYVHDRQTGTTELISALSNDDFTFFPEISSDGRWVSFMQSLYNCGSSQLFCSNVMIYDRQRAWMTNLTKYDEEAPKLPWSYSGSLSIPWETMERTGLAISPDGKLIALGGTDSKVRIWQISKVSNSISNDGPDKILETDGNDSFTAMAFTSGGEWLAAGTTSGVVYVWRLPEGKLLYALNYQSGLVRKLVFSQDGLNLVISTLNDTSIWSIRHSQLIRVNSFSYGIPIAYAIDVASDGNLLATSRGDGSVWVQNLPSGKVIGRFRSTQLDVSNLAFSDDGSLLASRSTDGTIDLWRIETTDSDTLSIKLISTIQSYRYFGDLAFSPDNKYLASIGDQAGVTLWNIPDGKMVTISPSVSSGMAYSLDFSMGGDTLAAFFGQEIMLWGVPPQLASSFYVHATMDNYVDSQPLPEATANDIPRLQSPANGVLDDHLNLDQAAALMPFPLFVPAHLPEDTNFLDAMVNKDGSVWLRYVTYHLQSYQSLLFIYEKIIGNSTPPTMTIGAGADVILNQIETLSGRTSAEYVRGDWLLSQGITPPSDGSLSGETHDVWQWDNGSSSQRLRWQQNGIFIAMYYQVNEPYTQVLHEPSQNDKLFYVSSILGQGDLMQIASGMTPYSGTKSAIMCDFVATPGESGASKVIGSNYIGQECWQSEQLPPHIIANNATGYK